LKNGLTTSGKTLWLFALHEQTFNGEKFYNMFPVSSEAPSAEWMFGLVSITSDTVSQTEKSPANASLQESLHKPDFLKIEETQGQFVTKDRKILVAKIVPVWKP
jgi:hypothetical protein